MIGSWGENVVSFLGSVPSKIGAFFSGVGDWLKSAGTGVIGGLAGGISGGWVQLTSFLGGIPGKIAAFFGGAGSWLVGAGKNIINGLISGIKSAFNAVKSTLSNLTSLLPSWKGPPSTDAKLLTANGKLIMQSLVDGLSSGFKPVQSLLGGMTNEIGGAFSDPALLSGMQVSGADITAAGSSALSVAGSVDGGAIASALEGWTVQLDETGLARLVNKGNNRVKRRR
jgi:phage-related protein